MGKFSNLFDLKWFGLLRHSRKPSASLQPSFVEGWHCAMPQTLFTRELGTGLLPQSALFQGTPCSLAYFQYVCGSRAWF
jgi:hypothetical protein